MKLPERVWLTVTHDGKAYIHRDQKSAQANLRFFRMYGDDSLDYTARATLYGTTVEWTPVEDPS